MARLKALRRELIDPEIAEHKGRIVKTAGDSLLVEFPSVVEAVACAVVMQQRMAERNKGIAANQGGHFLRAGIFKEACYSLGRGILCRHLQPKQSACEGAMDRIVAGG